MEEVSEVSKSEPEKPVDVLRAFFTKIYVKRGSETLEFPVKAVNGIGNLKAQIIVTKEDDLDTFA